MPDDRLFSWPPSRRWFVMTGTLVVIAAGAGIAVGLLTTDDDSTSSGTLATTSVPSGADTSPPSESPAKLTRATFTASRVGVACQVAGKKLVCTRAGAGRATLTVSGRLKLEPTAGTVVGGPALAPGQDWTGLGITCSEKGRGLHCVLDSSGKGFFVDTSGFVKR